MTHYTVFSTVIQVEDTPVQTYGIAGPGDLRISDVSPDRSKVKEMVDLFNENDLDPIHLEDAVEDMLP